MTRSTGKLKLMKRTHTAQITLAVRKHGPISRVHLAKITGLSITCVCGIVDELLAQGELLETGTVPVPRGRPMVLLDINPSGPCAAGVWLAPEAMEVTIANPAGEILARRTVGYGPGEEAPEAIAASIAGAVERCAEASGQSVSSLRGVGVSVAGLVDPMLGIIDSLTNRRGLEGVPIVRYLESRLHVPVYADNDVRAAALASHWLSDEGRNGGAIYMTVAEGVGAAFIHDGALLRGVHDAAGLLGHTIVDPSGPPCGCGNSGCLEAVASDIALIRNLWPEKAKSAAEMAVAERVALVQEGLALAARGDAKASWAMLSAIRYLGIAIANAISTLDPRTVLIGGTMVDFAPDLVIDLIRREAMQRVWSRARGVEIKAITDCQGFLLRGSVGLVLLQPYRAIREENQSALNR